jgi:hypothetical protein
MPQVTPERLHQSSALKPLSYPASSPQPHYNKPMESAPLDSEALVNGESKFSSIYKPSQGKNLNNILDYNAKSSHHSSIDLEPSKKLYGDGLNELIREERKLKNEGRESEIHDYVKQHYQIGSGTFGGSHIAHDPNMGYTGQREVQDDEPKNDVTQSFSEDHEDEDKY